MYHMLAEVVPIVFGHTGVVSNDCVRSQVIVKVFLQHYKRLLSLE